MDILRQILDLSKIALNTTDNTCVEHLFKTGENALNGSLWALKMVDASTKIPGSLLVGNAVDLGNFDECISVKVEEKWGSFLGQHCLVKLQPHYAPLQAIHTEGPHVDNLSLDKILGFYAPRQGEHHILDGLGDLTLMVIPFGLSNQTIFQLLVESMMREQTYICRLYLDITTQIKSLRVLRASICVPSTCSAQELTAILTKILRFDVTVNSDECNTIETERFTGLDWLGIGVLLFFALLCFASTMYDFLLYEPERRSKLLLAFSVPSNIKKLFSIRHNEDAMPSLNGVRVISMMWIVLAHSYSSMLAHPAINTLQFMQKGIDASHQIVHVGIFAVDTFLVLSGCLLCYTFLNHFEGSKKFNLFSFYIHRYMRLTPLLAVVVILSMSLVARTVHAPLWDVTVETYITGACKTYWWSTLLYIQNYFNLLNTCVSPSWYLSIDMQLFWISPIFLLTLRKWPRFGLGMMATAALVGICMTFHASWIYHDTPQFLKGGMPISERYYYTHLRYVPWLMGLYLGYVLYITKDWRKKVRSGARPRLQMYWIAIGWTFSPAALITALYGMYPINQPGWVYNQLEASLYLTLSHPLWSMGICWLLFACVSGHGGIVNTILSWKGFEPLSRLSYAVYLVHWQLQFMRVFTYRNLLYLDDYIIVGSYFADLIISTLVALGLTLLVESPMLNIENMLLKRDKPAKLQNGPDDVPPASEWKSGPLTSNIYLPSTTAIEKQI